MSVQHLYAQAVRATRLSSRLEKLADIDPSLQREALRAKQAIDNTFFSEFMKYALNLGSPGAWGAAARDFGIIAGADLAAMGALEKLKANAIKKEIRENILPAALGAAAVGGGLYGLHRLTRPHEKTSADEETFVNDCMTKLATIALLDSVLEERPNLCALNRSWGVKVVGSLLQ